MRSLQEIGGRRLPFLRASVLRAMFSMGRLARTGQMGDGREEALAQYVAEHARPGDLDDAIRAIDEYAYRQSFLINIGDEKGEILDRAVTRSQPARLLELGTYCGYSALRICRAMPDDARLVSIEFSPANAEIARRIWDHAGVAGRVSVIAGTLDDGGQTVERLEQDHGFAAGNLDFVFLDHAKDAYLPDLELILERGWIHSGSIVVADNVKLPGAPEYRAYMREQQGQGWQTLAHQTHAEYQTLLKDVVLESEYLGGR